MDDYMQRLFWGPSAAVAAARTEAAASPVVVAVYPPVGEPVFAMGGGQAAVLIMEEADGPRFVPTVAGLTAETSLSAIGAVLGVSF